MEEHLSQEPQLTDFHPDDVIDEATISEELPPMSEASQPEEETVGLTFSDGFQFGCGFALAITLAVILVVFGILLLSLLLSLVGINILRSLFGLIVLVW